jgi:hypothetical protein
MDDNTTKIIKERFDSLPESIQEVILSSNYEETLLEIGKQYNLRVDQLDILERETTLVMMGLTPTKNFETELIRELHLDNLRGSQIVKDINEKVFLKIRELLKLMNTPAGEEPSLEKTEEEKEHDIMKSAGIEILNGNEKETLPIPEKLELSSSPRLVEEGAGGGDLKEKHPILAQKLSGFTQGGVVETHHSLDNITKTNTPNPADVKPKIPSMDPYREIPE